MGTVSGSPAEHERRLARENRSAALIDLIADVLWHSKSHGAFIVWTGVLCTPCTCLMAQVPHILRSCTTVQVQAKEPLIFWN